jgi:hypothetical protein
LLRLQIKKTKIVGGTPKDEKCAGRCIEIKEFNSQIDKILDSISISERFKIWAVKYLHELRSSEASLQENVLRNKHKEMEIITKQLDALLLKYTSSENSDGQLISNNEKGSLFKKKSQLEEELRTQGEKIEERFSLSEKIFNFACYSRIWFSQGDDQTKRGILTSLGSNFTLNNGKLNIELHPFFKTFIENRSIALKQFVFARTSINSLDKKTEV